MTNELIDIIVPVWNHPVETRACLVSLIESSPNTRLILVDNSSDRETEQMLGEFAEALDLRVLFLKNRVNEGFVKAVNRGLSLAESKYVAIVKQNSKVRPGWLKSLHDYINETDDAGVVVPGYYKKSSKIVYGGTADIFKGMEVSSADFSAFLMRRSLLETAGKFSEDMDGSIWCLKEYSRRAWRAGYRTCAVPESIVEKSEEVTLGSAVRREELEHIILKKFTETWGEEHVYCIHLPKGSDLRSIVERLPLIASAARQGSQVIFVSHPSITAGLISAGLNRLHENISIIPISRLMPGRSTRNAFIRLSGQGFPIKHVSWDNTACSSDGIETVMFSEFEKVVTENERKYYKRDIFGEPR